MNIHDPIGCEVIARVNRFVVEVRVGGERLRASINNTGRLEQFLVRGGHAYCTRHKKPQKTDARLFAIADGESAAIIDTQMQMRCFEQAFEKGSIPWLDGGRLLNRNARLGDSLIDYLLEINGEMLYLEVKSAVLREGNYAMYPDCPTARGRKHIGELISHVRGGGRGAILFIAALPGVSKFKPYSLGDSNLHNLLIEAREAGVNLRAIGIQYQPEKYTIYLFNADMPVDAV